MRTSATSTYLRKKGTCVYVSVCKIERNIAQIDSTTCLVVHYVQDNEGKKKKIWFDKNRTQSLLTDNIQKKKRLHTHTHAHIYKQIRIQYVTS
jgi:hypothetical protein